MKKRYFIILTALFIINVLFAQTKEIFIPYSQNITILEGPRITYLNSFKNHSFRYIVHNDTIKNIKNYYKKRFSKSGYVNQNDQIITKKKIKFNYLKYINNEYVITLWLSKKNQNDAEVFINQTDNNLITDNGQFKLNNKKDNPGFDLKDIARPKDSIRVISILNSYKNMNDITGGQRRKTTPENPRGVIPEKMHQVPKGDETCNIIYKSKLSKKQLADFYIKNMKKLKWQPSYYKNFFHNNMGYWMTFNKRDKSCLISIMYMKEFKSNVVSIYYGYK